MLGKRNFVRYSLDKPLIVNTMISNRIQHASLAAPHGGILLCLSETHLSDQALFLLLP